MEESLNESRLSINDSQIQLINATSSVRPNRTRKLNTHEHERDSLELKLPQADPDPKQLNQNPKPNHETYTKIKKNVLINLGPGAVQDVNYGCKNNYVSTTKFIIHLHIVIIFLLDIPQSLGFPKVFYCNL